MGEDRIPELVYRLSEPSEREYAYADMEPDPIMSKSWERGETIREAVNALEAAQARIAALTEERDSLVRRQAREGTCGDRWNASSSTDGRMFYTLYTCKRLSDHSDDQLPDKGVGSRHWAEGASWGRFTRPDAWRIRAEEAEQRAERYLKDSQVLFIAAKDWQGKTERYRAALEVEHKARKEAQRCVGSLPVEMGQWFENRMAEADRSTSKALAPDPARPATEPDDEAPVLDLMEALKDSCEAWKRERAANEPQEDDHAD